MCLGGTRGECAVSREILYVVGRCFWLAELVTCSPGSPVGRACVLYCSIPALSDPVMHPLGTDATRVRDDQISISIKHNLVLDHHVLLLARSPPLLTLVPT